MRLLNVGEKVCLYKEKLNHQHFSDFARAANCSIAWLNDISKKNEIKAIADMGNLVNLCSYLGVMIDEFLKNDEIDVSKFENVELLNKNELTDDIEVLLHQMAVLLTQKEGCKIGGVIMNDKAKEVCLDSLQVLKTLVGQHL